MEKPREWWTLEQYAISLFETNDTSSPEFKALVTIFGRERLVSIWDKYKAKKKLDQKLKVRLKVQPGVKDGSSKV